MIKLTAEQIKVFDDIYHDKKACENTLKIALMHNTNRRAELTKFEEGYWEELMGIYGLDKEKKYKVESINNSVRIVEVVDDDS